MRNLLIRAEGERVVDPVQALAETMHSPFNVHALLTRSTPVFLTDGVLAVLGDSGGAGIRGENGPSMICWLQTVHTSVHVIGS